MKLFCLLVLSTGLFSIDALQAEQNWPGFLGAGHSEIEPDSIPMEWSPEKNVAWSIVTPGYGQSSPVIWGENVYISSVLGENKETLFIGCYSLNSGELLWKHEQSSSYPEKNSVYISRAAPTPVVDSAGIYAYFESGDVIHVSHQGEKLWGVSLTEKNGPPQNKFGLAASPVQTVDQVIILIDDEGPSYLVALRKSDGQEHWKTPRKSRTSWSSPMLIQVAGQPQVVCSSAGTIDGYDPQNGQLLWSFDQVGGNTSTSPTMVNAGQFLIAASPGRTGENAEMARKSNGLFTVTQAGDSATESNWETQFAWTNPDPTPSWASPIAHQGFAYWVNRVGVLFCLDVQSGETQYSKRIKDSCWATPVGIGDKLYFFGKSGMTTILAAGPEFKIVAENRLWDEDKPPHNNVPQAEEETEERRRAASMFSKPTLYGVAVVSGNIVLRTGSQLYCLRVADD